LGCYKYGEKKRQKTNRKVYTNHPRGTKSLDLSKKETKQKMYEGCDPTNWETRLGMKIKKRHRAAKDLNHDLDGSPRVSPPYPPTTFLEEIEELNGEASGGESE
jgi:hypothetical protein